MFTFQQYTWDSTKIKFANLENKTSKGCFLRNLLQQFATKTTQIRKFTSNLRNNDNLFTKTNLHLKATYSKLPHFPVVSTRLVHLGSVLQNYRKHSLDQTHLKQKMFTLSPIWTQSFCKYLKWRYNFNNLIGFRKPSKQILAKSQ